MINVVQTVGSALRWLEKLGASPVRLTSLFCTNCYYALGQRLLRWLIAHGAEIGTKTDEDIPPFFDIHEEQTALTQLEAGGIPTDEEIESLVQDAKFNHWLKLTTWLKAHGKWPSEPPLQ